MLHLDPTLVIAPGECIHQYLTWAKDGIALSLVGKEQFVSESNVPGLVATFGEHNAAAGVGILDIEDTSGFGYGKVNWIRIGLRDVGGDACVDHTFRLWVEVK